MTFSLQTQECEGLVEVVRELTKSRNKLTSMKSIQGERYADLQHDFVRVSRIADLSRALSRENISKAAHLSQCLNQVRACSLPHREGFWLNHAHRISPQHTLGNANKKLSVEELKRTGAMDTKQMIQFS